MAQTSLKMKQKSNRQLFADLPEGTGKHYNDFGHRHLQPGPIKYDP